MTALRTTRPNDPPRRRERTRIRYAALVLSLGLLGCGTAEPPGPPPSAHTVGANDPAWIVNRPALPPPDVDRINYDERTRTLSLYDLPGNDRWLVRVPGDDTYRPGTVHRLPAVDPSEVMVCYTRPGMRPSSPVSLKQIKECGGQHVSFAGPR